MPDTQFPKKQLGEVLLFKNGKSVKPGGLGKYPVYGSNGIIGGSNEYREENAIILGRVGAYCGSVAYQASRFWASDNTIVVYPKSSAHDVRFLSYLLANLDLNHWAGGAAQPLLTQIVLKQIVASIPDLSTQHKIAAILSVYEDLIENNLRRIKILEEMAQFIYREWFVKFRFPGHEKVKMVDSELGKIPEGWEIKLLRDIAAVNESSIRKGQEPAAIEYINISSVSRGQITKTESMAFSDAPGRARRRVHHGDTIWSAVRPNLRAYALMLNPPAERVVSTGFAVISPKLVPHTYLYQALTTDEFVGYLINHTRGAAYPAVNKVDFENAEILVPSGRILESFHSLVTHNFVLRQNLFERNQVLRRTCDLLLPKLISGQLDVSDLDIKIDEDSL